jgi:hypothetical protein
VSPARRCATNRARHLPTVASEHRNWAATVLLSLSSAQASTIFDRNANACEDFARSDHLVSCSRSSAVLLQMKGWARLFQPLMKARILVVTFVAGVFERCDIPPAVTGATIVGGYR